MPSLSSFQDAFCAALQGETAALAPWRPPDGEAPGLSVYRNTVAKGSADALAATYRTVEQLVGKDWFRAAAVTYAAARPPIRPSLLDYGGDFADWLASFPPAQDTPYLAEVARIDRLWQEAYFAPDAVPLAAEAFGGLRPDELGRLTTRLHPSARLAAFDRNIVSLWLAHQAPALALDEFELADEPERVLVVRPAMDVAVRIIDRGGYAFLASCAAGESLQRAAERALAVDPGADFPQIVAASLDAGVFAALVSSRRE
jgi:hypothetical protein